MRNYIALIGSIAFVEMESDNMRNYIALIGCRSGVYAHSLYR